MSIFSKYLIPFSAVTVIFLLIVQFASAEEEQECFAEEAKKCKDIYLQELQKLDDNRNYEAICKIIRNLIDCYGEAVKCDKETSENWRLVRYWYFVFYNGTCDWSDMLEEFPPEFASGIAFGDPHYAINGKDGVQEVVTCNDEGEMLLAQGRRWSVKVNHKEVGASGGTVVDEVKVSVYADVKGFHLNPVGAPIREVHYTLSSLPKNEEANGISIRPDGLSTDWGLEVTAKSHGSYFEVGVSGPDMNNGILTNGCENKGYNDGVLPFGNGRGFSPMDLTSFLRRHHRVQSNNNTAAIPEKCKAVEKAFQQACAFDANQLNETWAAESTGSAASLAADMKAKEKKAQEEANKKHKEKMEKKNGIMGAMTQGCVLLIVLISIILF